MGGRERTRALVSWSGGKDSAWMLHILRERHRDEVEVVGLLTTVDESDGRVATHAIRAELLAAQARAVGLPLLPAPIPRPCPNAAYEAAIGAAVAWARRRGVTAVAFGDLFLGDIRRYREELCERLGVTPLFPLWGLPTDALARAMTGAGLRARLVAVDPRRLDRRFAGREFDAALLAELPAGVDPCGEAGEFHTFAYAGPMFARPVPTRAGPVVERDGAVHADLLPADE